MKDDVEVNTGMFIKFREYCIVTIPRGLKLFKASGIVLIREAVGVIKL